MIAQSKAGSEEETTSHQFRRFGSTTLSRSSARHRNSFHPRFAERNIEHRHRQPTAGRICSTSVVPEPPRKSLVRQPSPRHHSGKGECRKKNERAWREHLIPAIGLGGREGFCHEC